MAASARLNESHRGQRDFDTLEMCSNLEKNKYQAEQSSPKEKCIAKHSWKKTKLHRSRCSNNWLEQGQQKTKTKALVVLWTPQALLEDSPKLSQLVRLPVPQSPGGIHSCRSDLLTVNWLYIIFPNLPTSSLCNFSGSQASVLLPTLWMSEVPHAS